MTRSIDRRRIASRVIPLIVIFWFAVGAAHAETAEVIGQIGDVARPLRQDSKVSRRSGAVVAAIPGLALYHDDLVHVAPCQLSYLTIVFGDPDRAAVRLGDEGQCDYRVTRQPPMQPPGRLSDLLHGLYGLLYNIQAPSRPIQTFSQGAGSRSGVSGGLLISVPHVSTEELVRRRDKFLNQLATQKLSASTPELFIFWNPDAPPPYSLALSTSGDVIAALDVRSDIDAVLPLHRALHANQPATLTIKAGDRTIRRFAITVVNPTDEPLAPGLPPDGRDDPRAATLQGLWLLAKGGSEWRLQAMSHLRISVTANQDFQAARVLRAVISGELDLPPD